MYYRKRFLIFVKHKNYERILGTNHPVLFNNVYCRIFNCKIFIMRNLLIIVFVLLTTISFSQSVSYVSCEKDTLLLPNNELGIQIYIAWLGVKEDKPVILLAPESFINHMNKLKYIEHPIKKDDDVVVSENYYDFPIEY